MRKQVNNLRESLILFVVAIILTAVLLPIWITYTLVKIVCRIFIPTANRPIVKAIWYIANTIKGIVKWIDQLWNVVCRDLFNDILIKKGWHSFWDVRETISSVLWKNERTRTLTNTGQWLVKVLDTVEENHCQESIVYILKEVQWHNDNEHW